MALRGETEIFTFYLLDGGEGDGLFVVKGDGDVEEGLSASGGWS
jgi:hypothetical protein